MNPKPTVVIVHGILMPCAQLLPMQKRLEKHGFRAYRFCYKTITRTMTENATALNAFLARKGLENCHFVGHSMGGLVIHAFLQSRPDFPACRAVALGSPFGGSVVARQLVRWPLTRPVIGKKAESSLTAGADAWPEKCRLGVIAGDKPVGIGALLAKIPKPHDGVVSLAETAIPGMAERIVIHTNHISLMFSPEAAKLTIRFLENGCFGDEAAGAKSAC